MRLVAIYAGSVRTLAPSGEPTGIYKLPIEMANVGALGIEGDVQVDKRYHGGPDKALHQYAEVNYARIAAAFPVLDGLAVPGSIGENLTIPGMAEDSVCIGDVYRIGEVVVQVSEPRQPCWKINAKYGVEGLTEFIQDQGIAGWYYRVLEAGRIQVGESVTLQERYNEGVTITQANRVIHRQTENAASVDRLIAACGIAEGLKNRLIKRREDHD